MGTHSRERVFGVILVSVVVGLLIASPARSVTLTGGRLVEDFSTADYADYTTSTGLWDTVNNQARAGVVAGGVATQTITFGDGSDGVLDTAGAVSFNTDSKPNGFNYSRVHLRTGATVTVTGSSALIIRSLTTLTIDAGVNFSLKGGTGTSGTATAAGATLADTTGGVPLTCSASGGAGGGSSPAVPTNGADGRRSDGAVEAGTGGLGQTQPANGDDAVTDLTARPSAANFFTTGFVCGSGGGGGGGNAGNNGTDAASGGAGGAGGGRVRLISVGTMDIQSQIDASGGDAGQGGNNGTACAGNGGPGDGGAVWLQTLGLLSIGGGGILPSVAAGADAVNACNGLGVGGEAGAIRADYTGNDPDLAATSSTSDAAPNQTYIIQSTAYDLDTLNAVFSGASVTASTPGGGSASVAYAGSVDGSTFSGFTGDITSLSNKNYRFFKFRVTINTAGGAAASPQVSQIAVDFTDGGLDKLELKLSPGCGTIQNDSDGSSSRSTTSAGAAYTGIWFLLWLAAYGAVRNVRRL